MAKFKFCNGDRVRVSSITSLVEASLFSVGDVGTVVYVRTDYPMYYVKLDEGQGVTEHGTPSYTSYTLKPCNRVYVFEFDQLELINEFDENYYKPGDNGWIPDRLEDGIDVMKITAELVTIQVGK